VPRWTASRNGRRAEPGKVESGKVEPGSESAGRALIHIGTHKTATTSLQTMVARNGEHFRSQDLFYPVSGRVGDGHHNLAWQLNADGRYRPEAGTLTDLAAELRTHRPRAVLISSEDFEYLQGKPDALATLSATLADLGYLVGVILMLRRPCDYLESLYFELGKHGLDESFATFLARASANGGARFGDWDFRLDYEELVGSFARVFGSSDTVVLEYDQVEAVAPLLGACGRYLLGVPLTPVPGWERFNRRPAPDHGPGRSANGNGNGTGAASVRDRCTPAERAGIEARFGPAIERLVRRFPAPGA